MIWKPKEKELTLEEALALAKKELAPYWLGCAPEFAGITHEGQFSLYPLTADFNEKAWVIFFIDSTRYTDLGAVDQIKEWHRRYSSLGLSFLIILVPVFTFMSSPPWVQSWIEDCHVAVPVVIDSDRSIARAFGVKITPMVFLMDRGKIFLSQEKSEILQGLEPEIQRFLRIKEPGLPLLPIYVQEKNLAADLGQVDISNEAQGSERIAGLRLEGEWKLEEERRVTSDPHARILFQAKGVGSLSLIAENLSKDPAPSPILVYLNDAPIYEAIAGEDISLEDNGSSVLEIRGPKTYRMVKNSDEGDCQIELRFPASGIFSVAIYGIRAGT